MNLYIYLMYGTLAGMWNLEPGSKSYSDRNTGGLMPPYFSLERKLELEIERYNAQINFIIIIKQINNIRHILNKLDSLLTWLSKTTTFGSSHAIPRNEFNLAIAWTWGIDVAAQAAQETCRSASNRLKWIVIKIFWKFSSHEIDLVP